MRLLIIILIFLRILFSATAMPVNMNDVNPLADSVAENEENSIQQDAGILAHDGALEIVVPEGQSSEGK